MKRRLGKPLIVMDGCTQETLAKFMWVSFGVDYMLVKGYVLSSCTFVVGWTLVRHYQNAG